DGRVARRGRLPVGRGRPGYPAARTVRAGNTRREQQRTSDNLRLMRLRRKGESMCRPAAAGLLLLVVALAAPCPAPGRGLESWPYKRLLRESDLVVIAYPVASADSGECRKVNMRRQ